MAKGPPNLLPSADCLAIALRNQKQFPLLRLPAELRTRIYEFTMDTNTDKILHDDYPEWERLSFSRISRQIFAETALSYFTQKLLPFHNAPRISLSSAKDWRASLAKLTPSQRCLATRIAISWDQTHAIFREEILDSVEGLPNLEVLYVRYPDDNLSTRAVLIGLACSNIGKRWTK